MGLLFLNGLYSIPVGLSFFEREPFFSMNHTRAAIKVKHHLGLFSFPFSFAILMEIDCCVLALNNHDYYTLLAYGLRYDLFCCSQNYKGKAGSKI